jgi:hypothetical protein
MRQALEAPSPAADVSRIPRLGLPNLWAITAVLLPVIASLEASLSSIDLAYHVRAGNLMLDSHRLARVDTFTFTAAGKPWLDQQWLAQLLFALVHRAGGWDGLHVLRAALVGLIYLFVFLACRAAGVGKKTAAGLTVAAFVVSVGGLALRPQLVGMALFALTVYLLFRRDRWRRGLWVVPAIGAVWANVHGSFFLGPLLVGLAFLDDVRRKSRFSRQTFIVVLVSLAAATLNPFGLRVWSYAAGLSTNPVITKLITEWQPPELRDVPGAIFFLSALAVAGFLARRRGPTPLPALLSLAVFFLIGLVAVRGIFWWALVAPPIVAQLLTESRLESATPARPEALGRSAPNAIILVVLIGLGVSFLPWWRSSNPLTPSPALVGDAPAGISAELQRLMTPGERMFNPQRWGSWFEFALPRVPVAVDSRIELFSSPTWRAYQDVSTGRQGWQDILDRWDVRVLVAHRGQQSLLIPIIRRDPGWRLVYQDHDGLILVRR